MYGKTLPSSGNENETENFQWPNVCYVITHVNFKYPVDGSRSSISVSGKNRNMSLLEAIYSRRVNNNGKIYKCKEPCSGSCV